MKRVCRRPYPGAILGLVAALALVTAQRAPAAEEAIVLSAGTVHTISGEDISPGQVLVREGKIIEVGKTVQGQGARKIDLPGAHLYPGLIALDTVLGLTEISGVRATLDTTESGDYTADVESWIAANPDSELIPVTRANGIAYFQPVPQGATVSGQSGLVAVDGWTTEQRTIRKPVALHLYWPGMQLEVGAGRAARRGEKGKAKSLDEQVKERRAKLRAAADFFEDARAYLKAKDAATRGKANAPTLVPAWEAMIPYLRGELPIMVHADDIRQIRGAVEWAAPNQFKIILAGGRDAWMAAELLATKKIPVVYDNVFTLPVRDSDPYDVYFRAPAVLQKAGVQVVFSQGASSFDAALSKNLPYCAAQAVAFGLSEPEALKGMTLYPAQLMGVADRLGTIEPGKEATLFASDGSILDIRSTVKHLWLAGREVSLENRHTRLYDKYRNRPKP